MDIYLIFVVILFALAASDLVVGVSNDAVNFLNSAIGSKVGARWIILIVASLGILVGVLFSSGMMEVARKGIFNPEMFSFAQIMVIFIAVMLADILILDLFNTYGMPTSTTVSIVFELLGAAVVVSVIHLIQTGQSMNEIFSYINSSKAILIVSGIFLSVFIAFSVGLLAQFGSRLLFSFKYEKKIKKYGAIWAGLSMTILAFFIIIKGFKGATFVTSGFTVWVQSYSMVLLLINLIVWTTIFKMLQEYTKINILKVVVFAGTFSLALAFASNDLVNFVGVPIAGFQSFKAWSASGVGAELFMMDAMAGKVPTPTLLLLLAGVIMTITLWRSKKARTVTATEINLSKQGVGEEKFRPHLVALWFVRANQRVINFFSRFLSKKLKKKLHKSYDRTHVKHDENTPAFDMIRASVNLTIASMLIAIATSYKMPLSTTYVSFMVAMGTSLADLAWGKESAVHRVSGVLNVIGGWFMTAVFAFSVAGLFAFVIYSLKIQGLVLVIGVIIAVVFVNHRKHKKRSASKSALEKNLLLEDH